MNINTKYLKKEFIEKAFEIMENEGISSFNQMIENIIKESADLYEDNKINQLNNITDIFENNNIQIIEILNYMKEIIPNILNEEKFFSELTNSEKENLINLIKTKTILNYLDKYRSTIDTLKNMNISEQIKTVLSQIEELENYKKELIQENKHILNTKNLENLSNYNLK